MESAAPKVRRAIEEVGAGYFKLLEQEHPGSLFNNCSYALWYERYVQKDILASEVPTGSKSFPKRSVIPLAQQLPAEGPQTKETWNHISDWTLRVPLQDRHVVLFGCTEDVKCTNPKHEAQHRKEIQTTPFHCRTLCPQYTVPVCSLCSSGLKASSL